MFILKPLKSQDDSWLKDKTLAEVVFLWKIGHVQKKFVDKEDALKFKQIQTHLRFRHGFRIV